MRCFKYIATKIMIILYQQMVYVLYHYFCEYTQNFLSYGSLPGILPKPWNKKKMASKDQLRGFKKRNVTLTFRKSENYSTTFSQTNVNYFYDNLQRVLKRQKFKPL